MKLVLQCAMCGTQHPVGTPACSTCRASGVLQMRLMFACPSCGELGLAPTCGACAPPASPPVGQLPYEVVEDFVPAEVVESDDVVYSLDDSSAGEEINVDLVASEPDRDIFEATLADEVLGDDDEVLIDDDFFDSELDED